MLNSLRRWVDPRVATVRVADVQAYLQQRGWKLRPAPRPRQLAFEAPTDSALGPAILYVPASEQSADYSQRILEVVTGLAEIEGRYAVDVLNDILHQPGGASPLRATRETAAPR